LPISVGAAPGEDEGELGSTALSVPTTDGAPVLFDDRPTDREADTARAAARHTAERCEQLVGIT
jgi:hypothetical protein